MKGGYESLVWLNDEEGKEYVCTLHGNDEEISWADLGEDERKRCMDVNLLIGTERW